MATSSHTTFHWEATADTLVELAEEYELVLSADRRGFEAEGLRVLVPLLLPIARDCSGLEDYLAELPLVPGLQVVVLLQAGAVTLGLFDAAVSVRTKSIKRYVVRGRGKAQPAYLNAKGKSRYGSRLRLQNARALLEETAERLNDWWAEYGAPEQVYYNCPVRLWSDLLQTKPAPPFGKHDELIRVPLDLPVPTTDVLLRSWRGMGYGRVEFTR